MKLNIALLGLGLSAPALATDVTNTQTTDIENQGEVLKEQKKKVDYRLGFETQWHEYNNIDFRPLDESTDQTIRDSDDRGSFAFTGARVTLGYQPHESVRFVIGASHRGLWGNDMIGKVNRFGGWLYFTALHVDWTPTVGNISPMIRVGRQFFEIGGIGGTRDYVLRDIVDQVRIDLPIGEIGSLVLIPVNVLSETSEFDNANFVSFFAEDDPTHYNFRGDHMTRRHGGILVLDNLPGPVEARAYGFYTDVGSFGRGTGSDISYNGLLGNFTDNDWVVNWGLRTQAFFGPLNPWFAFEGSNGIDRKEAVAYDVDTNGFAVSGGLSVATGDEESGGLNASLSFFQATGAAYASNGMRYSHGYVGMKGMQIGGTIANRFLGMHPSAYVGMFGVAGNEHRQSRTSGTRVINAEAGYAMAGPLSFGASYWFMQDTGVTDLDFANIERIDPPYGYSRDEFAAEERLGKVLGHEVNLDVGVDVNDHLSFGLNGAVFLPGAFYGIDVARIAGGGDGTQLGGDAIAWGINAGTRVNF